MVRPETDGDYTKIFTQGYLFHTDEKENLARTLRRWLKGRRLGSVLDVGPGGGEITRLLAGRAGKVSAIEPQAGFARNLRRAIPGIKVRRGLVQKARFKKGTFDLILASHMLYYIPIEQWDPLLRRMRSWLKPGGRLLAILSAGDSDWFRSVSDLSRRLGVLPNFSFAAPEQSFRTLAGGADELLNYRADFTFTDRWEELRYFLVELELLFPYRLLSPEQIRRVDAYIRKKKTASGFRLRNKFIIGVWRP